MKFILWYAAGADAFFCAACISRLTPRGHYPIICQSSRLIRRYTCSWNTLVEKLDLQWTIPSHWRKKKPSCKFSKLHKCLHFYPWMKKDNTRCLWYETGPFLLLSCSCLSFYLPELHIAVLKPFMLVFLSAIFFLHLLQSFSLSIFWHKKLQMNRCEKLWK